MNDIQAKFPEKFQRSFQIEPIEAPTCQDHNQSIISKSPITILNKRNKFTQDKNVFSMCQIYWPFHQQEKFKSQET
ncbi:unnamed protein product [Paramecium pentaurelia]|uniref:Uncharacterized protein n=1 Tax=Paramecium pentaurelia TaxID=43138 RepID=A0A8S1SLB8_9CILI|nr:unnamed protein product [Paramecium pentaurelia]